MKDKRHPRTTQKKSRQREPEIRVYSKEEKAMFILNSAFTEAEYEEARREVREMGLDPTRIKHHTLLPVEWCGRDLIIYEPLASKVRVHCRRQRIGIRRFILRLLSGRAIKTRRSGKPNQPR
jgi:hypothetical protein